MKNLLLASTSSVYGKPYLTYLFDELTELLRKAGEVLFIPYARPDGMSYIEYTAIARKAFNKIDINLYGIHEMNSPKEAIVNAKGIFTGGGNTFVLLNTLYQNKLITPLRQAINSGTPYLGTSAGSNICGPSIMTTNDMPIVYPPSFEALGILPFNINPHYLDANPESTHMGETRETRIKEYLVFNNTPVLGIREGGWVRYHKHRISLEGNTSSRWFEQNHKPRELSPGSLLYKQGEQMF